MKYSKQRELIYQTVMQNMIHPSADTVYALMREQMPGISLGTVYRNLNLLSVQGKLLKISMPNASDHFDACTEDHNHIICEVCSNVYDVKVPPLQSMTLSDLSDNDFQVTGCHIYFTGVCGKCSKKS